MDNKIAMTLSWFGTALATSISFSVNKSIGWAIVHGALNWVYVVYYGLFC